MPMEESGADNAPTESIDYVMFRREHISYDDKMRSYTGESLPRGAGRRMLDGDLVYLAMPPSLQTSYSPSYRNVNLGVGGQALVNMWTDRNDMDSLAQTVQTAAAAALPEFSAGIITSLTNNISGMLGLQGNMDVQSLNALTGGRVMNPYQEQIFQQMNFRSHSFSFKLVARNIKEAQEIEKILKYFKAGALPEYINGGFSEMVTNNPKKANTWDEAGKKVDAIKVGDVAKSMTDNDYWKKVTGSDGNARRFFRLPDKFQIKFRRYNPSAEASQMEESTNGYSTDTGTFGRSMHFKIKPSVCNGIQVNYTPDNQYTSFKHYDGSMIQVPAIVLSLSFLEAALVTKEDIPLGY